MLSVAILGPVEVHRDGERVAMPAGKTTELLVRLALVAGTMVRTDRLLDDLWAEDAVATSRNTLQSKVSQLRRALSDPGLVIGSSDGYCLAIDPSAVDALEVARLADEVTAFRMADDASNTSRACAAALTLFRGEGLYEVSDAEWLAPHRAQLDGLRLRLVEDRLAARMQLGATGEVVGDLAELVAAYPLREGLCALLITALYRDGRQADALAAYQTVRERLAEELGLDPSPELQRLEQLVLQQDASLDAPVRAPTRPQEPSAGNVPALSSTMIGRDRDLDEIARILAAGRFVTVVGPAGVGKTRLAIEIARRSSLADGAWFVRLDSARGTDSVVEAVADALHANGASESSLTERVLGADLLIVLDNCEHVVEAAADLAATLLSAGPGVRVLATSQLPFGSDGESVYVLRPLTRIDSVALFAARAAEHGATFASDSDAVTTVDQVCRSLDGLPLAIELAAARTKSLSIQEILRRLDDRFSLLSDPTSRRPDRRRTLSAAIAWSYDLLFPDDQRGLWAIACFDDGAPLGAIEHVVGALGVPLEAAVDVVGRLVDRSLVSFEAGNDGTSRYRLLDSVRSFAAGRLHEAGSADIALRAHAEWFAAASALAADGVRGPDQAVHLAFARIERANIDSALAWASANDPALGLQIANDLGWVWVVLGDGVGVQRVRAALGAAVEVASTTERARALFALAWLEASAGDVARGHEAVAQALDLLEPNADPFLRAKGKWYLAYVLAQQGRFSESLGLLEDSRPMFRELGCDWELAASWVLAAHCTVGAGDPAAADAACREAARELDRLPDPWLLIHVEAMLGAVAQSEHRFGDACEHLGRAARAAEQLGFAATEAYHLANLGRAQQQHGDLDAATVTLHRAVEAARATADLRVAALARTRLSRVLREQGQLDVARTMLQTARDWYQAFGGGDGSRLAECLAVSMTSPVGTVEIEQLELLRADAHDAGDVETEVLALDALARISADAGDVVTARERLATADGLMPTARHHVVETDRVDAMHARRIIG